jgi:hypothetical protein
VFGGLFIVGGVSLGRLGRLRRGAQPALAAELEPPAEPS